jgi:phosphoglycerate dehydrogenase-like enzyme
MKLVISKKYSEDQLKSVKAIVPGSHIVVVNSEEEQAREIRDADILLTRVIPTDLSDVNNLKWIQFIWEGVDHISDELRTSDIMITNAGGAHSIQMAEHIFSYILTHFRKVPMYLELQKRGKWLDWPDQPPLRRLFGSTIGILGYGRIGRAVAVIAKGFGMEVLVYKKDPRSLEMKGFHEESCCDLEGSLPDSIYGPDQLEEMLPRCDIVVVTLPLTDDTRGLIGENEFRLMKCDCLFINVGRGPIVDQDCMLHALEEGEIGAAGLDVFDEEPLPDDDPLWKLDNVIITPHSGVGGDPADDKIVEIFAENLRRFLNGDPLINLIDKSKGY